jgi:hypothetical protein
LLTDNWSRPSLPPIHYYIQVSLTQPEHNFCFINSVSHNIFSQSLGIFNLYSENIIHMMVIFVYQRGGGWYQPASWLVYAYPLSLNQKEPNFKWKCLLLQKWGLGRKLVDHNIKLKSKFTKKNAVKYQLR